MKKVLSILVVCALATACNSSKKNSTVSSKQNSSTPINVSSKPSNGVYAPGTAELEAIQLKYADTSLEQLKRGYSIYAEGACINCHGAKDIYRRDETHWKDIIGKMSVMAKISEGEKEAVYRYVLSVKALQGK
jgi:outer membrane protein assembly factor BamD (BamD/ComL family)